jgi:hypothetical protein
LGDAFDGLGPVRGTGLFIDGIVHECANVLPGTLKLADDEDYPLAGRGEVTQSRREVRMRIMRASERETER